VYTLYLYVKKKNEKTYLDTITWWREAHVTRPTRQVNPYGMCVSPTVYTTFQFPNLSTEPRRNTPPAPDALTAESSWWRLPPWPLVPTGCRLPPSALLWIGGSSSISHSLVCSIYGRAN
jgi:hypothetical protein